MLFPTACSFPVFSKQQCSYSIVSLLFFAVSILLIAATDILFPTARIKRKGAPLVVPSPHYNHLRRTDCCRNYPSCHCNFTARRSSPECGPPFDTHGPLSRSSMNLPFSACFIYITFVSKVEIHFLAVI